MFRLELLNNAIGGKVLDVLTGNSVVSVTALYNKLDETAPPTDSTLPVAELWLGALSEFRDCVGDQAWLNAPMHQALFRKVVNIHDAAVRSFLAKQKRAQKPAKRHRRDSDGEWLPPASLDF